MISQGSTVKLAGWKPQKIPVEEEEKRVYHQFIVEAVEMLYATYKSQIPEPLTPPVSLAMIYTAVKNRIGALLLQNKWSYYGWISVDGSIHIRKKRTVDRRVNEAASLEYGAKIRSVNAGFYVPEGEM